MYIVKGFRKNTGNIDGKDWCNYSLFCTCPDDPAVIGESVSTFKVKPAVLEKSFAEPRDLIGATVAFCMEQRNFGGKTSVVVTDIIILKKGE